MNIKVIVGAAAVLFLFAMVASYVSDYKKYQYCEEHSMEPMKLDGRIVCVSLTGSRERPQFTIYSPDWEYIKNKQVVTNESMG